MRIQELTERLQQLGVIVSEKTLRRWGESGTIKDHRPNLPVTGRGNAEDWPQKALEEAAAVWAVRHSGVIKQKALTSEMIKITRRAAAMLDERPFAVYTFPPVTGPLSTQHIAPEDIKMKFVSEDFDGLDLFPGANNTEKAECLNKLVVAWIAAVEKVREWESMGMSASNILEQHPEFGNLTMGEIDFSQVDPWRVDIPCPWRIDKPALVELFWWSRPSKNGRVFYRLPFPLQRKLHESDRNDIILCENFVDTREFFKIDIGDREGWAKDELEKIEREREEKETELRRLGMEDTNFSTLVAMERSFETLTEEEKLGLKTAQEWLGLARRQASVKNWGAARPPFSST